MIFSFMFRNYLFPFSFPLSLIPFDWYLNLTPFLLYLASIPYDITALLFTARILLLLKFIVTLSLKLVDFILITIVITWMWTLLHCLDNSKTSVIVSLHFFCCKIIILSKIFIFISIITWFYNNFYLVSKPAPDWNGTAVINGEFKDVKLSDFRGRYLVFFFYPLDLYVDSG